VISPLRTTSLLTFLVGAVAALPSTAEPTLRVFVTNEKDDSISVIDSRTNKVEKTIAVGKRPRGIGLAPDGTEFYVALGAENAIAVVDPKSLAVLRKIPSGDDPEAFDVHSNGNIYLSNEDDAKATVLNPKSGQIVAQIPVGLEPEGVAVSPDGKQVIVTSESTNMLHVINVPGHEVIANILVGSRPRAAVFSKDGKWAYASSEIGGEVKRIDMSNHKIVNKRVLADDQAKPKDVRLSKDERTLYVAGGRANKVFVLDAETLEIKKDIPVGERVWGLAISRDGRRLYTTNGLSHSVSVIDTTKSEVMATVDVGQFPWGIVIDD